MSPPKKRVTITTQLVLRALLVRTDREMYGKDVAAATGLSSGTVARILDRLESTGWVTSRWVDSQHSGRPRRRYFRLTDDGITLGSAYAGGATRPIPPTTQE